MSIQQDQIVDLLYKQAFGVTKTDTEQNKSPSNESIPSPLLNRGDTAWTEANQIPVTAGAVAGIVQAYTGSSAVECTEDNTTVPISGIYPTWKTGLTYWIPTEFGSTYQVQVWVDSSGVADPTATGTQIFADGSGGVGEWYFNYQSGVLNFIGETIPTALTAGKVLYIVGYRYIGLVGVTNLPSNTFIGDLNFTNTTISSTSANGNIIITPDGTGVLQISSVLIANGNIEGANFTTSGVVSATGNVSGGNLTTSGNVDGANLNLTGLIDVAGNITSTAGIFNGDGYGLSNIPAANITGLSLSSISNGTSNVRVFQDANVTTSVGGNANVLIVTGTGILVNGTGNTIQSGAILANGTVTANGNIDATSANISGQATVGNLYTDSILAPTGNITISAAGTNESIYLVPTGTGVVDVAGKKITELATPTNPNDAATKEYVDAIGGTGLTIHSPVRVEANSAIGGTYAQGGTTPTVDQITGGNTIVFTASHGLSENDGIVFDNSFNGLTAGEGYWVFSVPSATSITVKDGYFGAEVTGLTNGTSLAEPSRANPGVGATLTNSGANAALVIDGITVANNDRVLIYAESTAAYNGVYDVTDSGNASAAWVLTRSSDMNKYIPASSSGMGKGDYLFIEEGASGAGESYVLTAPDGEIIIGTSNVEFTQFSSAGSYTAGAGIDISGTTISANVDGVTTAIVGGNIAVKTSAQFTTPNIGVASGTSLTVTGNVSANNLSISNIANIDGNLTVGANIIASDDITANANIFANNANITTLLEVPTANVTNVNATSNIIANTLTINLDASMNTANFSGNVVFSGDLVTIDNDLSGNTGNFSGNVGVLGLLTDNLYYANGQPWDLQEAAGSNTQVQFNSNNDFGASANFTFDTATDNLTVTGNVVVATGAFYGDGGGISNVVGANVTGQVANSAVAGTVYTNAQPNITSLGTLTSVDVSGTANIDTGVSIGANQISTIQAATVNTVSTSQTAIATFAVSGVSGIEFLVKGRDASGGNTSVATVLAVTDGSNVDYSVYGSAYLVGATGALAVGINGSNVELLVTPSSGNSTQWITQYRFI
jgi:hypothetical protein